MKQEISWQIDVARVIQALGLLILLIYGMYQGYDRVDDFLDICELEVGIARMEAESNSQMLQLQAPACAPLCVCEP